MKKHKMTHKGDLVGCDARTPLDYRETIELRETANYWMAQNGRWWTKYRKRDGYKTGEDKWPMFRLDLKSIRPIEGE